MLLGGPTAIPERLCCQQGTKATKFVDTCLCDQCGLPDADDATQASASEASFESSSTHLHHEVAESENDDRAAGAPSSIPSEVCAPRSIVYTKSLSSQTTTPSVSSAETSYTTSSSNVSVAAETPVKGMLKSSLRTSGERKSVVGKRRVRGLWNEDPLSPFAEVHDVCLANILSYLPMADLCTASAVCVRWKQVASFEEAWTDVDATTFVRAAYRSSSSGAAAENTSQALSARLDRYSPLRLTIQSIHHQLSADSFHPSLKLMQELTLTDFDTLTDTHVRLLLLPVTREASRIKAARAGQQGRNQLRKLALRNCPLLTNACLHSIAQNCPNLQELDLSGNTNITDLTPLASLWKIQKLSLPSMSTKTSGTTFDSLFSLPTRPATPPRRPQTPPATSHLASLFAPPGQSPIKASNSNSLSTPTTTTVGKLTCLVLDNTGVTASSLVKSLSALDYKVELKVLSMKGSGESWKDADCKRLAKCLDTRVLEQLEMSCASSTTTSKAVSDTGLRVLLKKATRLAKLGIAGHAAIGAECIARLEETTEQDLIVDRGESALQGP